MSGTIERKPGGRERDGGGCCRFSREFLAAVTRRDNRPEIAALSDRSWERQDIFGYAVNWWRGR